MCNLPFHSPKKICNEHHNYDFTCIFQVPKKSFLKVKIHCRVFCSGLILWLKTINFFVGFRSYMTAHCCRIISSCPKIGTNRVFTMHSILHQQNLEPKIKTNKTIKNSDLTTWHGKQFKLKIHRDYKNPNFSPEPFFGIR